MCLKVPFFRPGAKLFLSRERNNKRHGFGRVRCRAHLLCAAPLTAATTPRYFCFTFIRSVYEKYIAECVGTMFLVLLACGSAVLA